MWDYRAHRTDTGVSAMESGAPERNHMSTTTTLAETSRFDAQLVIESDGIHGGAAINATAKLVSQLGGSTRIRLVRTLAVLDVNVEEAPFGAYGSLVTAIEAANAANPTWTVRVADPAESEAA